MGITKTKLIIVFVAMIIILSGSYFIHLYETKDSFKVENIPYGKIDTIEISKQETPGNNSIIISNRDSIKILTKMLINSKIVSSDDINTKAYQGEYFIFIHTKNGEIIKLYLINTSYSGGILRSGDYSYQNTPFLSWAMKKLKD
jgi:hypothetical protein